MFLSTATHRLPILSEVKGRDRIFPAAWARRHARERLGIESDEMDGGHYISLSRPRELAERLSAYADEIAHVSAAAKCSEADGPT